MLHIINTYPISNSFLADTRSGDTVIFTENAVLAVKQENCNLEALSKKALKHINLYVRKADLLIKNISNSELLRGVTIIDDVQFNHAITHDIAIKSYN